MITLLHLLSYVGSLTAFLFVTLSLASGLLWLAELIEEHTRTARVFGVRAIYAVIALHVLLFAVDRLPFLHIAFSIACHVVYLQHFNKGSWPFISLTSPIFLASCVLVVADHFMWFFYFAKVAEEAKRTRAARYRYTQTAVKEPPTFMDVAAFFAFCVWAVPLFLFLSLSANDNVIPSFGSSAPPSPMGSMVDLSSTPDTSPPRRRGATSLIRTLLVPVVNLIPKSRRSKGAGGIIAPPTPASTSPIGSQNYSPWGERSNAGTPTAMYASLGVPNDRVSGTATPPPRRVPSAPPKSRSASQTGYRSQDDENVFVSSKPQVAPERIPYSRSHTTPAGADAGGLKSKAD